MYLFIYLFFLNNFQKTGMGLGFANFFKRLTFGSWFLGWNLLEVRFFACLFKLKNFESLQDLL